MDIGKAANGNQWRRFFRRASTLKLCFKIIEKSIFLLAKSSAWVPRRGTILQNYPIGIRPLAQTLKTYYLLFLPARFSLFAHGHILILFYPRAHSHTDIPDCITGRSSKIASMR